MIILSVGIAVLIFIADGRIKSHVERWEPHRGETKILGGRLILRRYHNRGMALGMGRQNPNAVAALSVTLTILAALALFSGFGRRANRVLQTGLALLLGGAFSNTYDRLKRRYVVDYFSFGIRWEPLRRLVFNISDFCIITGALLTVLGTAG